MAKRFRLKRQQLASELAKSRMSQNRWADKLDLGRGHLSLLVNGKRPYPSEETRRKLIEGLGVPFSTLFEVEDVPMPGSDRPRHLAWIPRDSSFGVPFGGEAGMSSLAQDVRYAARSLAARPLFSLVVLMVLALGIGANTAMYSWVDGLLLDPLTVPDPERWVTLTVLQESGFRSSFSYPTFEDHRERNEAFDDLVAWRVVPVSVSGEEGNERAVGELVSGNFLSMLDGRPVVGRMFSDAEDEVPGRDAVVVLAYGYWQRRFAGDPEAVGRELVINARPYTVIGVMGPGFGMSRVEPDVDLWVPLAMQEQVRPGSGTLDCRGCGFLSVAARIPVGTDLATATERVNAVHQRLAEEFPDSLDGTSIALAPAAESYLGGPGIHGTMSGLLAVLMAMVGAVLLICCANVAALLLARAADREREIGVRQALGASRPRLLRLLMAESVLLAGGATVLGLGFAWLLDRGILGLVPPLPLPIVFDIELNPRVLMFTAGLAAVTAVIFGLVPALRASRFDLLGALRGGDGRVTGGSRLRSLLVTGQIALSLLLLIGAALFVRSLGNASDIDPGFDPSGVLVASLDPGLQGYSDDEVRDFYRRLVQRVGALPGVESAALAEMVPLGLGGTQQWGASVEGYEPAPGERMNLDYNFVGPGYFETLGIPIVQGRGFTAEDTLAGTGAIIVNETMARRFWPDGDPLGRRVHSGGMWREVVGVAADIKYYSLGEEPLAYMYFPYAQSNQSALALHVRGDGDPLALVDAVRGQVHELDPGLPLFDVRALDEQLGLALLPARLAAVVLGAFGVIALLLAAVGLYGVIAYAVRQRTREIGIRIAMGAEPTTILQMVLRQAALVTGSGILLGLAGGVAVGRLASGLLYGVDALDPVAHATAVGLIALVAVAASTLPARRATRVDPVDALRTE